eukprot:s103_g66.t1
MRACKRPAASVKALPNKRPSQTSTHAHAEGAESEALVEDPPVAPSESATAAEAPATVAPAAEAGSEEKKMNEDKMNKEKEDEQETEKQETQMTGANNEPPQSALVKAKAKSKPKDENENVELSPEVLLKLQNAEDEDVEKFWLKLSTRQQQMLWKKFQKQRQEEGTEAAYKQATCGTGMKAKAKGLVKLWLKHGSTKHPAFETHLVELRSTESFRAKEKWVPLETIKQKYGIMELKARCLGGSIKIRKSASDPRFPEFQDLTETKELRTDKMKSKQGRVESECAWADFKALSNLEVQGQVDLEFMSEGSDLEAGSGDEVEAQALALNMLESKKEKELESNNKKAQDALASFETASALADEVEPPAGSIMKCQKKLKKHLQQLAAKSQKELKVEIKERIKALDEIKEDTPVGVAKKALNAAAATGKRAMKAKA